MDMRHCYITLGTSLVAETIKNLPAMQETLDSIFRSGKSTGEGSGYLLQYSCLKNSMDRETCGL